MSVAGILIAIPVLAIAIIIISFVLYNRRLDKITKGEIHDTHTKLPEPSNVTGATYKIILMAFTVIILINISTNAGLIRSQRQQIEKMQQNIFELTYTVEDLKNTIDSSLSLTSYTGFEVLETDMDSKKTKIMYEVMLNEYTDDTEVALILNDEKIPFEKKETGKFVAEFYVDTFGHYREPKLTVTQNGITKAEASDFPEEVFWDVIPMPLFNCTFNSEMSLGKAKYSGYYNLNFDRPEDVESVTITYLVDGKETKTTDITAQAISRENIDIEKGMTVKSNLVFLVTIKTKSGLTIEDKTVMIYDDIQCDVEDLEYERIYDKDGKLLWENDYK